MSPNNEDDVTYFTYFHSDLLLSTEDWPTFDRVVYFWLLMWNWFHGPLPTSPKRLADICGVPLATFGPIWKARLRKKFAKVAGGLENPRVARDRAEAIRLKKLRIEGGRRGGEATAKSRAAGPRFAGDMVSDITNRLKGPK